MSRSRIPSCHDLTEPLEIFSVDHEAKTLKEVCVGWAKIDPVRAGGERYIYQAEQRILRGCYRVWTDQAHPVENHLLQWHDTFYEIVSAPVYDPLSPWQYFIIEEVQDDLSDYDYI